MDVDKRVLELTKALGAAQPLSEILSKKAEEFNITGKYLMSLFKKTTGKTVSQVHKEIKLEAAKEMVESSYLRMKEISSLTGFENYSRFSQEFKLMFGFSPNECRTRQWENDMVDSA